MNVLDCIELIITNDGLGRPAGEPVTNLARRGGFLACTIEKLSRYITERSFRGRTFFSLLGKRRFNAKRIPKWLVLVW
jgi:hypothetical protein